MEFLPGGACVAGRRPGTIWRNYVWVIHCGCRQCWTASGVTFLQSPSNFKTIKLRNLFKAANGGMITDFLICDDFIENVDSGLYELKLFSLIYF